MNNVASFCPYIDQIELILLVPLTHLGFKLHPFYDQMYCRVGVMICFTANFDKPSLVLPLFGHHSNDFLDCTETSWMQRDG